MIGTKKLSTQQIAALRRLATKGPEQTPGGSPTSGREASAWHRTMSSLVRRGLALKTRNGASTFFRIAGAGLRYLEEELCDTPSPGDAVHIEENKLSGHASNVFAHEGGDRYATVDGGRGTKPRDEVSP